MTGLSDHDGRNAQGERPDASIDETLRDFRADKWYQDPHGRAQSRMLGRDLSVFDYVGRLEEMDEVFRFLSVAFHDDIRPRHDNVAGGNVKQDLTREQKAMLNELYREDFELLGYQAER
jgi:hypothetical protein